MSIIFLLFFFYTKIQSEINQIRAISPGIIYEIPSKICNVCRQEDIIILDRIEIRYSFFFCARRLNLITITFAFPIFARMRQTMQLDFLNRDFAWDIGTRLQVEITIISHVWAEKTSVMRVTESREVISLILRTNDNQIFTHNQKFTENCYRNNLVTNQFKWHIVIINFL